MIDDDDVGFAILAWPFEHPLLIVPGLILVAVVWYYAVQNDKECSERSCDHGTPALLDGECVCTEKPR